MKSEKKLQPRKATRSNAIKAAQWVKADSDAKQAQHFSYYGDWFSVRWYEESWLYGGSGGQEVLDALVAECILEADRYGNYRLTKER